MTITCVIVWLLGAAACRSFGIWIGVGSAACLLGCIAIATEGPALRELLRPTRRLLTLGLLAAAVMVAATYGLYPLVGSASPTIATDTHSLYSLFTHSSRAGMLLLPLIILAEEIVWRGVVQGFVARRLNPTAGVLIAAVLYAAAHIPLGYPLLVVLAVICGLFWSAIRAHTNSLLPGLIAHLVWDLLVFVLYPLARG